MAGMRILQIGPVPPEWGGRDTGGIATHLAGLSAHLAARGHDVSVLADNVGHVSLKRPDIHGGVRVFGGEQFAGLDRVHALLRPGVWRDIAHARGLLAGLGSPRWVVSKVASYRAVGDFVLPELVHVHTLETRFSFATAVFGGRIPIVATAHSTHYVEFADASVRPRHEALVRGNISRASDVVFVSRYLQNRYDEVFGGGAPDSVHRVLPNPIDAEVHTCHPRGLARARLGLQPSSTVLLCVGNLIPRKDPESFIVAAAKLIHEGLDAIAVLVGEGEQEAAIRSRADAEGIADRVRFEGPLRRAELDWVYSAADLLVFPSLMESFGLVALEAMLLGLPVVGCAKALEEVVPPFCGIRVEPGDPVALAGAVREALSRSWDRDAIRAHARGFDWESRIDGFETMYTDVISR
ncbi:MAG: glycosyltransferase family 4 protein [Coriobacteriia bacterium]